MENLFFKKKKALYTNTLYVQVDTSLWISNENFQFSFRIVFVQLNSFTYWNPHILTVFRVNASAFICTENSSKTLSWSNSWIDFWMILRNTQAFPRKFFHYFYIVRTHLCKLEIWKLQMADRADKIRKT